MKISLLTATICIGFGSMITTAYGQIHAFDASPLKKKLDGLQKVDFENLPESSPLLQPSLPNPMTIDGVTFTDPAFLHTGFCSAPTCLPDPHNSDGGNMELFLNPGAKISLPALPRLVVLDIQGNGDNPFELLVTDGRGHKRHVRDRGVYFEQNLLGLVSGHGIKKIELAQVGGTGGPLALARILFSERIR